MKQYTKYELSLHEGNGNTMTHNIYAASNYEINNQEMVRVISTSDSDGTVTLSRQNGVAKLIVDGDEISFNEKLWYKVVETILSLNLEMLNSGTK
jgi:hypothetical protein